MIENDGAAPTNFIRAIIDEDLSNNKHAGRVATRFPPEPNGYLHIGHAKSICLNFGIARDYNGTCNLRFDDTNPCKEDAEFEEAIRSDIEWLGFKWNGDIRHASDYFPRLYEYAVQLIKDGKAYVCSLSADEIREYRGTLTLPGKNSPYRDRSVAENLELFEKMKSGAFKDGTHVLRAKIDMAAPNIIMRDPTLYRIRNVPHHVTGHEWCIYPMYDYTHCICDSVEHITHSICTLEFENNRPLYDWVLDTLRLDCHPQQIEFSRLEMEYIVTSKRKLKELVDGGSVCGWDDPRMPTIVGLRRRGFTSAALRDFVERVGVTKKENRVEMALLENCVREDLDANARRAMAVLRPIRVVIDNYPEGQIEELEAENHPKKPEMGVRRVPFSRTVYIERDDFKEEANSKYFRLAPGKKVRLRYAYVIECVGVVKDEKTGEVVELHCTFDPETLHGKAPASGKVKGIIHWVSEKHAIDAEVRLYDRLFLTAVPGENKADFKEDLNPNSLEIIKNCKLEASLASATSEERFQFERQGFFCVDRYDSSKELVFNRTVTLRDTWAKIAGH